MPAKQKKQTRNAEATKAAFVRAGETMFAKHGLTGATVDMIAAEANANKALVSYYFGSKSGLFEAVITALVSDVVADVRAQTLESDDPARNFRSYIKAMALALHARPSFAAILLRGYTEGSMQLSDTPFRQVLELFQMTRARYEAGLKAKLFRKLDPHLLHLSLVGPVLHYIVATAARRDNIHLLKDGAGDPDIKAFISHHQAMILAGLRRTERQ